MNRITKLAFPAAHITADGARLCRHRSKSWLICSLTMLIAALALTNLCASAPFTFNYTGSLSTARTAYTATLLQSGKVLVAGGQDASGILASAELYDPATGAWTATGSLST